MGIGTPVDGRWNHNLAYHGVVLDELPAEVGAVLDVGCGEGTLARQLATRAVEVTGIDLHEPSIDLARSSTTAANVHYVVGDVLVHEPSSSYDAVVSVATVHHLDLATALRRFDALTAPGGTVVVIGLARRAGPRDLAIDAAGALTSRLIRVRRDQWVHPSPIVWPPPDTYAEVRSTAATCLPGSEAQRRLLFRYSLVWHKPRC